MYFMRAEGFKSQIANILLNVLTEELVLQIDFVSHLNHCCCLFAGMLGTCSIFAPEIHDY